MNRALLVSLLLVVPASAWACDDGSPVVTIVGTLKGGRALVRESSHEGTRLGLYLLDLAQGVTRPYANMLSGDESDAERERVRGQAWKKAQSALEKEGLVLETLKERPLPFTIGNVVVSTDSETDPDSGCTRSSLKATSGKKVRVLDTNGYCGSSDVTSFSGVLVTTDGKYLIPMVSSGCSESTTTWVKSYEIASLMKMPAKKR